MKLGESEFIPGRVLWGGGPSDFRREKRGD